MKLFSKSYERNFTAAAGLILTLAIALRIPTLDRSLWLDEAYTAWFSALPLRELWTDVPTYETHPPMYYTIIHFWRALAGSSEIALRLPSFAASVATVLLLLISGRLLVLGKWGDRAGLVAGLLLAFNGSQIGMAQSARPYALQTLTASLAILMSVRLLRSWQIDGTLPGPWRAQRGAMLVFIIASGATLWLHVTSVLITLSIWAGLLFASIFFIRARLRQILVLLFLSGVATLFIWSPFLREFIAQNSNMSAMQFWLTFDWRAVVEFGHEVAGGTPVFVPITLLLFVGLYAFWKQGEGATVIHLVTVFVVPLALLIAISLLGHPVFLPRLLFWTAPMIMYLAACGLLALPYRKAGIAAIAICLVLMSLATKSYYDSVEENWLSFFQTAAAHAEPNDLFLVVPNELQVVFAYYQHDYPPIKDVAYIPGPFPFRAPGRVYVGNFAAPRLETGDIETIKAATAGHQRIWLVTRGEDLYDAHGLARAYLGKTRTETEYWNDGRIQLDLFQ